MAINCLRCKAEITKYRSVTVELPLDGQGGEHTFGIHALVICTECGHFEILHKNSPLIVGMEKIPNTAAR
jgi:hypothetical protein